MIMILSKPILLMRSEIRLTQMLRRLLMVSKMALKSLCKMIMMIRVQVLEHIQVLVQNLPRRKLEVQIFLRKSLIEMLRKLHKHQRK